MSPRSNPTRHALGRAVRELRHERDLTQEALAYEAGLHWRHVGGIERGERNPSWVNMVKPAGALGVGVSELSVRAEALA